VIGHGVRLARGTPPPAPTGAAAIFDPDGARRLS
jgi:hypothetical protein